MSNTTKNNSKVTVIESRSSIFEMDFQELWSYRDLLFLLIRRDFIAKYKQTILGPLWFILQPLITTVVFTLVFSKGLKVSTDEIPPILFYLSGIVLWEYCSKSVSSVSSALYGNAGTFSKVYFPRLIIPLSILGSNFLSFCIQLITFGVFFIYFNFFTSAGSQIQPSLSILFVPLLFIQTMIISLGIGLWVMALTVKYRDLKHVLGFGIRLWMYGTPIIYPLSIMPEKYHFLIGLNPMTNIIECFRLAFFGTGVTSMSNTVISLTISFVMCLTGLLFFRQVEQNFIDSV